MSLPEASLWEALGRPRRSAPLPGPRTAAWAFAHTSLLAALALDPAPRARPAAVLWTLLAGTRPRPGATWAQLCDLGTVDTLLAALARRVDKRGVRLSTWNVRWLLSPHTERAMAKKAAIGRVLRSGSVALLQ